MASASFPGVPVLLVLFFLEINITPSLTQDTEQLIERICRQMEHYRLVMEAFQSAAVAFFQKDYDSVEKSESGTPRAEASCMRILLAMALVSVHELKSTQNNEKIFIMTETQMVHHVFFVNSEKFYFLSYNFLTHKSHNLYNDT
ncbi:invertase inhibitor [Pyrus ussuriensis x Pyrus communis]|uniref:Invertase inhibitor n=1 Tax=Pyrus ussuriensis x Pyrus communis TaxID=2448454 RepID=A0A5N5HVQ4_9ROSA|nr:invertase inhibitor [Pyrus ussuriensis x Pyrus communis]